MYYVRSKIVGWLLRLLGNKSKIKISELHQKLTPQDCHISDSDNKLKFIEEATCNNKLVYSDSGWIPITYCRKSVKYKEYEITLRNGSKLIAADDHIFVVQGVEILLKDLKIYDFLETETGLQEVISILPTGNTSNMYDLQVDSTDHTYYTNNILSHNSTTIAAGFMLHQVVFGDFEQWGILANKGSTSREILSRLKMAFEYLPLWIKPGVEEWNKGKISLDNGCSVLAESTSSDSIRGRSLTGLLLDEFAHVDNANDFFTSVMPVISSGLNTKIVIVSTPNGKGNLYHKLWEDAVSGKNGFVPYTADWKVVPERDEHWKKTEIKSIGEARFRQEYECSFSSSQNTLIDLLCLENIPTKIPKLQKSGNNFKIFKKSKKGHTYFICVDPARGVSLDYSVFHVIDITRTPFKQVATYRSNDISPLFLPNIIVDVAKEYNDAYILMELNKGADIAKDIYYELEYENLIFVGKDRQTNKQKLGAWTKSQLGLLQSNSTKLKGCSNLKLLIETGKLELCDAETINELYTFVKSGASYSADKDKHDDLVMALVLFAWATNEEYFKDLTDSNFVQDLKLQQLSNDILPFGYITDYIDEEEDDVISSTYIESYI